MQLWSDRRLVHSGLEILFVWSVEAQMVVLNGNVSDDMRFNVNWCSRGTGDLLELCSRCVWKHL